jgi:hypothetical protein
LFFFGDTSAQQGAQKRKLANISDDAINSNQQSVPTKFLAGRALIAGDYISPAYNQRAEPIKTQTGKNQSSTTGHKYFASFAFVFCMGGRHPVDAVYKVVVDSDIVWTGNIVRGNGHKEVITVPNYGVIHLYWGDETQGIDNILLTPRSADAGDQQDTTTWDPNDGPNPFNGVAAGDPNPFSGHYDKHPAYRGRCYAVFKDWKLGRERTQVPNIQLELKRGCPWFNGQHIAADNKGVNPIAILYDWLTDPRFGMEFPESQIDLASFVAAYQKLEAKGARFSVMISEQQDFRQAVAEFLEYFDGWIRRSGNKLQIGMWDHGDPAVSATLTDDDLLGDPELQPQGWGPTLNEVTVVYNDRDRHYNTYSQVARDPNNRRITGSPRPITLQRPWITDAALAKQYAQEYCKIKSLPFCAGTLNVKREWLDANNLLPGQVFEFDSGFYTRSFLCRLLEIEYPADNGSKAALNVEVDRSRWPSLYIPPPFQGPPPILTGPRALYFARITEVPYLMQDHRFQTQVTALAIKGNVEVIGYRVWVSFDGGLTYSIASVTDRFSVFGVLPVAIGTLHTTFLAYLYGAGLDEVVSQTLEQTLDDTLLCFIDDEVISIGLVIAYGSGLYGFDCLRHRFGSAAQIHGVNSHAYFIRRSDLQLIDNANLVPGATVKFKLQPFTADSDYDLTSIDPIDYTVIGWNDIASPVVDPPGGAFSTGSVHVDASADAGFTLRYTLDGTQVWRDDFVFPAAGITVTPPCLLRIRAFADSGRYSGETFASFVRVAATAPPPQEQCAVPSRSFSGIRGQTAGNITLTPRTSGSTIKFRKNGGAIQTYSSPVHLNCTANGDIIVYWATKPGLADSQHVNFDNSRDQGGGGGQGGGGPPHLPP